MLLLFFWLIGPQTILKYGNQSFLTAMNQESQPAQPDNGRKKTIILFGDSADFWPPYQEPPTDETASSLSFLLEGKLRRMAAPTQVEVAHWSCAGLDMFDYYCLLYEAVKYSPDLIVIPVNIETFGEFWMERKLSDAPPQTVAFVPLRARLPADLEDPLTLRGISAVGHFEYRLSLLFRYPLGMKKWTREKIQALVHPELQREIPLVPAAKILPDIAEHISSKTARAAWREQLEHLYEIRMDKSHLQLASLSALVFETSKTNTKLLFYIWPLDREFHSAVGLPDTKAIEQLKRLIYEETRKENIYLVDLSDLLGHKYFFDLYGHCEPEGRQKIAEALAPEILKLIESAPKD